MSLDCILLGLLRQPASGTDLNGWFTRAFHHFWAAEPSQIYRTLARLEESELVSGERHSSAKGPPQRIYSITPPGRACLHAWLRDGPSMSDTRLSQLAQILFLAELSAEDREQFLHTLRNEYKARLDDLYGVAASVDDNADPSKAPNDEEFFRRLTVDAGIHQYESWIRWVDRALALHASWARQHQAAAIPAPLPLHKEKEHE
ncbi:MAG: PadR family transcriptional regulator [Phycisphaerales bacterium]|nr:PadR family transcriptional regulator [Phycisphaerales bacterium]